MSEETTQSVKIRKEPLVHIIKRAEIAVWKAILIRIIAVILALVVCGIIIVALTGYNPLEVYIGLADGALGTTRRTWATIKDTCTLLLVGLALVPAFKMRFWNIGAEGQMLMGGCASAAIMIYLGDKVPTPVLIILMLLSSLAAGIIWGVIPAIFKANWNTNETLFTLMMNYVAVQLVNFAVTFWEGRAGSNVVGTINPETKAGWLSEIFGKSSYGWHLIIVLIVTLLIFVYMRYTKHGYEIAVVGESQNTAKYAGINVKKVIIRTMALSGAIAALAGFLAVAGADHTIKSDTAGGRGFTAIVVAWLAKLDPFTMILMSFLLVFLSNGSVQIATQFNLNDNMSDVITGIILFFILGCEFFANYKVQFRKRGVKA